MVGVAWTKGKVPQALFENMKKFLGPILAFCGVVGVLNKYHENPGGSIRISY